MLRAVKRGLILVSMFGTQIVFGQETEFPLPELCRQHPQIELSKGYNPSEHPDLGLDNNGHQIAVPINSVYLIPDVSEVDDQSRTISMNVVAMKSWTDPRIQSNATTPVSLSPDFFSSCLWSPTFIYDRLHSVDDWDLVKPPNLFTLQPGPVVTYTTLNRIAVSCGMNFEDYPFDRQTCDVVEMAFGIAGNWIDIVGQAVYDDSHQRELQYTVEFEEDSAEDVAVQKSYFGRNVSAFGWRFKLKRQLGTHVLSTFLPTSLFVSASWISFLIPPSIVPGRMTLLVTLLLMEVNLFTTVAAEAPTTPRMSAMLIWCISCISIVMAAVIQYGVILYRMHLGNKKNKVMSSTNKNKKNNEADSWNNNKLDRTSVVVFPMMSILFGATYWIYHLNK